MAKRREFHRSVVQRAWIHAAGRLIREFAEGDALPGIAYCQCQRVGHHNHPGTSCDKQLVLANRGRGSGRGEWEANHYQPAARRGPPTLGNCEILCVECHKQLPSPAA